VTRGYPRTGNPSSRVRVANQKTFSNNRMEALAILESGDNIVSVLCPHCSKIHQHPASVGRLTATIPAVCDPLLLYSISATMPHKSLISALKGHQYSLVKKRKSRLLAKAAREAIPPARPLDHSS